MNVINRQAIAVVQKAHGHPRLVSVTCSHERSKSKLTCNLRKHASESSTSQKSAWATSAKDTDHHRTLIARWEGTADQSDPVGHEHGRSNALKTAEEAKRNETPVVGEATHERPQS